MSNPMRRGRLQYIRSYWAKRPLEEGAAFMALKHVPELIAEIERLWVEFGHDDPPLAPPDHIRRGSQWGTIQNLCEELRDLINQLEKDDDGHATDEGGS